MRDLQVILNEVKDNATKDNSQSWNSICITAMEQAVKERVNDIINNIENILNSDDKVKNETKEYDFSDINKCIEEEVEKILNKKNKKENDSNNK